jgi:transposase
MNDSIAAAPLSRIAAYIGIDWADQKQDVILRPADQPNKIEHRVLEHKPEALMEWIGQLKQRFGGQGRILICLEQSRGALIHHLRGYELFELYPINPKQLSRYRETFSPGGAKDDRPDADLLCELLYCHRDRLRAWKPDTELTRKLALFNEGRRAAVDERNRLSNAIKSQLKVYYPLALELLDQDTTTALAADLLLQWPSLEALQKQSPHKLRKFFYAHNCRGEAKMLERLQLVQQAKALTEDSAVIEPAAFRVRILARQLKHLLASIVQYDKKIAALFEAHPDRFLFENLPGAGRVLAPRLLSALGSDPERWASAQEISTFYGIAPVRRASGQRSGKKGEKKASVHFRQACPKFLRQSWHEFAGCSIRYCCWARAHYEAQRAQGKGHHAAVRAVAFKWI